MMEASIILLGVLLLIAGAICCVVPAIPGPLLAYGALLSLYFLGWNGVPSLTMVIITGIGTVLVLAADMIMPGIGAKKFNSSRWGVWGSIIGSMVGAFFFPWGLLIGPFAGAFVGELVARKRPRAALKGAFGAFLGFSTGLVLKLEWCFVMTICYLWAVFAG